MELHPYLHKVQFYETDGMSIVHHGNHILWMEEAGIDFAVYSVSCAYKSMTRYGETVAITVKVNKLQLTKLELGYRMVDSVTGQLRAEGTSVHFFYDRAKGRPVSLKKALPEVYTLLDAFVET